jgi:hypothetical protein
MPKKSVIFLAGWWLAAALIMPFVLREPLSARPGAPAARQAPASPLVDDVQIAHLPLILRRQDPLLLPTAPTAPPSDTPTATPTPTDTPTPTATPEPTETPRCVELAKRMLVSDVSVAPDAVVVRQGRGFSGSNRPVILSPLPDGSAKVAWSDANGQIHITPLDLEDGRGGADLLAGKSEVRGFVAHDDGAALLRGEPDDMWLVRFDKAGKKIFEKQLVGTKAQNVIGSKWIDDWGHEGRLVWSGSQYGAYFGHTQLFGANDDKHQGDLFWLFDEQGDKMSGGWDWGCSHSLDLRLAHNGERFGPVCLSDAFPKPPGIYFSARQQVRHEPSGDGRGGSDARLGGLVPVSDGFVLTFISREDRASADVGLVHISSEGEEGPVVWLTDTPEVDESSAHLARYGRGFLAGWVSSDSRSTLAVLDAGYRIVEGPVSIQAAFGERDDWMNFANGDAGWAYAWDDMSKLKIVRVAYCEPDRLNMSKLTNVSRPGAARR